MGTMVDGLQEFESVHGVLLASAGLPGSLWRKLYEKLKDEVLDGGRVFEIEECEGGLQRRLLLACERLGQCEDVFLIDHAWSFRLSQARQQVPPPLLSKIDVSNRFAHYLFHLVWTPGAVVYLSLPLLDTEWVL